MGWFRKPASEPVGRGDDGPVDGGWRELAVVEPAIGAMPLTMQTSAFEAALPTRGATRWIRPLTHATSPAAPSGVIDGLVTVLAGLPASVRDAAPLAFRTDPPSPAPRRAPAVLTVDAAAPEHASTTPEEGVPAPGPPPAPALGAARPLVVPAAPPLLLTTAPRPTTLVPRPIHPVVSRSVEMSDSPPVDTPASAPPPVLAAGRDAPDLPAAPRPAPFAAAPPPSEPASPPPPDPPSPGTGATDAPAPSSAEVPERVQRPAALPLPPAAGSRRLGLGAPIADRSRAADPSPSPSTATDAPLLGAAAPDVSPPSLAAPPEVERGSGPRASASSRPTREAGPPPTPPPSAAGATPHSAVRPTTAGPGPGPGTGPAVAASAGPVAPARVPLAVAQRAATGTDTAPPPSLVGPPGGTSVATLAARPLTPASSATGSSSARDRRSAAGEVDAVPAAPLRAVENLTGVALDGVVVHRSPDIATQASRLGARAYTAGGQVHIPAEHGSLTTGEGAALTAHELVHVAQQRVLGSSLPSEASPAGRRLEASARRAELPFRAPLPPAPPTPRSFVPATVAPGGADPALAALGAGIAQRAPDGSIVFDPPASDADAPSPVDVSTVQGAPAAEAPVHGDVHGPAGLDDNDKLEQLAKQLYDKIRDRLKAELRLDRERWGRVTDLSR